MKKFEFKKPIEEVEIAGKLYEIDLSDEKIKEYQKEFNHFYKRTKELESVETEGLSEEEQHKLLDDTKNLVKEFINRLLGNGAFDELYEVSGKSLMNMMELVAFIAEIIGERGEKLRNTNRDKYLKKINKNKKK